MDIIYLNACNKVQSVVRQFNITVETNALMDSTESIIVLSDAVGN